jgi:hypothetical protein
MKAKLAARLLTWTNSLYQSRYDSCGFPSSYSWLTLLLEQFYRAGEENIEYDIVSIKALPRLHWEREQRVAFFADSQRRVHESTSLQISRLFNYHCIVHSPSSE